MEINKPRLVFFQWQHHNLPDFLRAHLQLHVKCLEENFEVNLVNYDCDYQEICDKFQPDLALFESGYKTSISKKIQIANTNSNFHIPKIGLHNGDPWCDCRIGFISDMAHWGIETFFTISTTTAEHTPEIADNLFVWANCIDTEVFKDYGQHKIVPLLFTGNTSAVYPWRNITQKIVANKFPSLSFPHLGYESYSPIMIHGEQYARTINGSYMVPACGTIAKEIIRKHFEIPACKSCLITEESPALKAAGFVDMLNCVFTDEHNVLEKINYLFNNREELAEITQRGYELVQNHHTYKHRDQIYQWFILNQKITSGDRIVQSSPFEPLKIVRKTSGLKSNHIRGGGLHLQLIREGDEKLSKQSFEEAENSYLKCLDYISWMPEPKLKLGICSLYKGDAKKAMDWILTPIQINFSMYKAFTPEPVEWAYLIRCLLCQGKLTTAVLRANQYNNMNHPELARISWAVNALTARQSPQQFRETSLTNAMTTVHSISKKPFDQWLDDLCFMLEACNQIEFSRKLKEISLFTRKTRKNDEKERLSIEHIWRSFRVITLTNLNLAFNFLKVPQRETGLPSASEVDLALRIGKLVRLDILKKKIQQSRSSN